MKKTGKNKGKIIVISSPSGGGKTSLIKKLLNDEEIKDFLKFSISVTTRNPRNDEKHGVDYYFVSKEEFERLIREGKLVEWALVYGNYYGTPIWEITNTIEEGKSVILDIDVQGAKQIKEKFPQAVLIFINPPSLEILKERLKQRGTESPEEIEKRIQIAKKELEQMNIYDYIITNDAFEKAYEELKSIIKKIIFEEG